MCTLILLSVHTQDEFNHRLCKVFSSSREISLFQVLNFDSPRGGISLETEKTRTGTTSKLLVTRATEVDSGSYTCDPSRGQPKTADVHIITGKNYNLFHYICITKTSNPPRNLSVNIEIRIMNRFFRCCR